jgi:2-C-methyl-D-erythritol 4-phosphate cytidylyltransferase
MMNLKITTGEDLRLASAVLHALPKPKSEGSAHPFAGEQAMRDDIPKIRLKDLFS